MATVSPTRHSPRTARPVHVPPLLRRPTPPTRSREERLAEARVREVWARRDLALAIARMERTYALAARDLADLEKFLSGVRRRLWKAGYLDATVRSERPPQV